MLYFHEIVTVDDPAWIVTALPLSLCRMFNGIREFSIIQWQWIDQSFFYVWSSYSFDHQLSLEQIGKQSIIYDETSIMLFEELLELHCPSDWKPTTNKTSYGMRKDLRKKSSHTYTCLNKPFSPSDIMKSYELIEHYIYRSSI